MTRKRKYDTVDSLATVSEGPRRKLGVFLKRKREGKKRQVVFFRKTNSQHKESVIIEKKKLNEDPLTQVAELTDS